MGRKQEKAIYVSGLICAIIAISLWLAWGNTALMITEVPIVNEKIPKSFSGYRIAQISDLHNAQFGKDNANLLEKLQSCNPDIIVLTGDLVDSYQTDIAVSIAFAQKAAEIAPVYYVTGNHESRISQYNTLLEGLSDSGVTILQNASVTLEKSGEQITLLGVQDPSFQTDYLFGDAQSVMDSVLSQMMADTQGYTILLSHRPELFDIYAENGVDLVLAGHAHGGQFRLPFVGGLIAPGQGFFPEYDAGVFTSNHTSMVVSRGIGDSILPLRINNRPEIVVVELSR